MSIPTQLGLYNQALRLVGEGKLATLTDNRPGRYFLDSIWDEDPIKQMLEETMWTWATKTLEWNFDPSFTSDFGYRFAFTKPVGYVRTVAMCSDEFFFEPIYNYADENNMWYCELETIYLKFVSDDVDYGRDYSIWTELFRNCVATKMAKELAISLTKSQAMQDKKEKEHDKYLKDAKSLDAMSKPTTFARPGSWTRSRLSPSRGHRGTYSKS